MSRLTLLLPLLAALATTAPAQHTHTHDAPAQTPAPSLVDAPTTYAAAIDRLVRRSEALKEIASRGLERTLTEAQAPIDEVSALSRTLVRLAMQKDSAFPPIRVRDLNVATRELTHRAERARAALTGGNPDELALAIAEIASMVEGVQRLGDDAPQEQAAGAEGAAGWSVEIIATPTPPRPGEEASLQWIARTPGGEQAEAFDDLGAQRMWLLVASKDLAHFELHTPMWRPNHRFTAPLTFPMPGDYALFHRVKPAGEPERVIPHAFRVPGAPSAPKQLEEDSAAPRELEGGLVVAIADPGVAVAGEKCEMLFIVSKDGSPYAGLQRLTGVDDKDGPLALVAAASEGGASAVFGEAAPRPELGVGMVVVPLAFERPGLHKLVVRLQDNRFKRDALFVIDVKEKR